MHLSQVSEINSHEDLNLKYSEARGEKSHFFPWKLVLDRKWLFIEKYIFKENSVNKYFNILDLIETFEEIWYYRMIP